LTAGTKQQKTENVMMKTEKVALVGEEAQEEVNVVKVKH
jgi:hypothetical protein